MPEGSVFVQDRIGRAQSRAQREAFSRVRNAEYQYAIKLRAVARHIADMVKVFAVTDENSLELPQLDVLMRVLERYQEILRPWARKVAEFMLHDVRRRDAKAWTQYARFMGVEIKRELESPVTREMFDRLLDEQVDLITSLPVQARQRIMRLAQEHLYTGARASEIVKEIQRTGEVTKHRAETIARTETSRAATNFTMIRADQVGSKGYIWRTSRDYNVRPLHKELEGTYHRWDDPPIAAENGIRSHPGAIFNCRCYPEVVLPDY
jgi:SPP1 gp7 family putative phage head morphogenesis protein